MKISQVLLLAAFVSFVAGLLTVRLFPSDGTNRPAVTQPPQASLESALESIRRDQEAMRQTLKELQASSRMSPPADRAPAAGSTGGLTAQEVEAIVARALEKRAEGSKTAAPALDEVAAATRRLLDPSLSEADRLAIWEELARKGMLDAVLAEYERRVGASPQDSEAYADLGFAYHQKMRHSGGGPEAGKWGQKGSDAYARALELDETNWDARFAQAQHFYYADMQGDALQHLNVLRDQQKNRHAEDRHVEAFIFLGNLYLELGNAEEARKVWQEGLALFPGNERLRSLLQTLD
jgi:tetratricopeptide (TPR) repeat protein